jgi:two-component system chemotaxis response regulator CheY
MRVLIVDDSNFSQMVITKLIEKYLDDIECYFANDGEQGLKKYKEIKPDYVIVDLLMPKLNGGELIKLIKEYDKMAKIIVVSADVQKTVKEEMREHDIMTFINKPINDEKAKAMCDMMKEQLR